ncbi:hypothetical protein OH77DRAFT_1524438 [Trametes cingulata]|nr:hypothetical protein OH77DRAFT_1524438 [Trametes cingulata]
MKYWLNKKTYKIMSSLFGGAGKNRGILKWRDFVSAMSKLGFKCTAASSGGPRRIFEAKDDAKLPSFSWDEPSNLKGGELSPLEKARLAKELQERYGWTKDTFNPRK